MRSCLHLKKRSPLPVCVCLLQYVAACLSISISILPGSLCSHIQSLAVLCLSFLYNLLIAVLMILVSGVLWTRSLALLFFSTLVFTELDWYGLAFWSRSGNQCRCAPHGLSEQYLSFWLRCYWNFQILEDTSCCATKSIASELHPSAPMHRNHEWFRFRKSTSHKGLEGFVSSIMSTTAQTLRNPSGRTAACTFIS